MLQETERLCYRRQTGCVIGDREAVLQETERLCYRIQRDSVTGDRETVL